MCNEVSNSHAASRFYLVCDAKDAALRFRIDLSLDDLPTRRYVLGKLIGMVFVLHGTRSNANEPDGQHGHTGRMLCDMGGQRVRSGLGRHDVPGFFFHSLHMSAVDAAHRDEGKRRQDIQRTWLLQWSTLRAQEAVARMQMVRPTHQGTAVARALKRRARRSILRETQRRSLLRAATRAQRTPGLCDVCGQWH